MRNILIIGLLYLAFICLWSLLLGCQALPPAVTPVVTASPTPAPEITVEQPEHGSASLSAITDLAGNSACAAHNWVGRGRAPKGYYKGVALVYAKALCHPESDVTKTIGNPVALNTVEDAVAYYKMPSGDTLAQVFNLLIGLGLRESSGNYCCGRDMSASFSSADSAEAGTFQASWGARLGKNNIPRAGGILTQLFNRYSVNESGCFLTTFKEGASCGAGDAKTWGTGDGAKWQELTKRCPAFGAEYAAILLRVHGGSVGEFGPIRNKAAEARPECASLLSQVKILVQKNPSLCGLL